MPLLCSDFSSVLTATSGTKATMLLSGCSCWACNLETGRPSSSNDNLAFAQKSPRSSDGLYPHSPHRLSTRKSSSSFFGHHFCSIRSSRALKPSTAGKRSSLECLPGSSELGYLHRHGSLCSFLHPGPALNQTTVLFHALPLTTATSSSHLHTFSTPLEYERIISPGQHFRLALV